MSAESRLKTLNDGEIDASRSYVLYWMQAAQRADDNAALHHAIKQANRLNKPVLVCIAMQEDYPDSNLRHFAFMMEGFAETHGRLAKLGIRLVGRRGPPVDTVAQWSEDAALVIVDAAYLKPVRDWRSQLAKRIDVRVDQIESEVIVPVEMASDKREYAARTLRPSINRLRDDCHVLTPELKPGTSSLPLHLDSPLDFSSPDAVLESLEIDRDIGPVNRFTGGTSAARKRLTHFIRNHLEGYAERRSDPSERSTSELSPYLHFGQIGVNEVVDKILESSSGSDKDKEAYLEELIVRRELAINFVYYADDYDSFQALPDWALKTLDAHRNDERPKRYTAKELESAETDDRYWNAAMHELIKTGYMHNAMRMYWGKKVLEWSNTPAYAWRTLLGLNNRYLLDGRDASSWANVGWVFGLHDQAWQERDVFGKVRYMNAKGLERKFDIDAYVEWVDSL